MCLLEQTPPQTGEEAGPPSVSTLSANVSVCLFVSLAPPLSEPVHHLAAGIWASYLSLLVFADTAGPAVPALRLPRIFG